MELALHLGMPADLMLKSMTESELAQWSRHVSRHAFPFKRIEILLAQLALVVAKTMGGAKNLGLNDFMLKTHSSEEELPANVTRMELARRAVGFHPHKPKA